MLILFTLRIFIEKVMRKSLKKCSLPTRPRRGSTYEKYFFDNHLPQNGCKSVIRGSKDKLKVLHSWTK